MDAKKNKTVATKAAEPVGPVKIFRIDEVSVSLFARTRNVQGEPVTFYSATFSRSYKDADGQRKYSHSFDPDDLGKIVSLAQQVHEFVIELAESRLAAA